MTLLAILDGAVSIALGPECSFTSDEREMIAEPLGRIMARMTPETSEMIDKWTDPILLATGLLMWGARVFMVIQRRAEENKPAPRKIDTPSTPVAKQSNNGELPVEIARMLG